MAFRAFVCIWRTQGLCRSHFGRSGVESEIPTISKMTVVADLCPWSTPGEEKSFPVPPWEIWKTQQWPQDWKRSVFIPIPKKGNAKECSNYRTIATISHASKVMLKILQARLQQYVNWALPNYKLDLEKAEESEIKLPSYIGSLKKQENSKKTSTSASLTTLKPLTVRITTNCGNFLKRWEYQTTLPASWEICMQFKKQQLELDMEQRTVPNWERSTSRLYNVTLVI